MYRVDKDDSWKIEESVRARELGGFARPAGSDVAYRDPADRHFFSAQRAAISRLVGFQRAVHGAISRACVMRDLSFDSRQRQAGSPRMSPGTICGRLAGFAVGLYIFIFYPSIVNSLGDIATERVILGCVTILLFAEASRRLSGLAVGHYRRPVFCSTRTLLISFPGDFYGKGWSISRLATYLYLDANGIFGQALQVGASIVIVFVIFGEVLYVVGGAEFLSDFSLA